MVAPTAQPLGTAGRTQVDDVRRFNRLYTRRIGVLPNGHLGSRYSLAEARIIYELAHAGHITCTAAALAQDLGLDPGYLSRLLNGLKRLALLTTRRSRLDGRSVDLSLTAAGRRTAATLEARARRDVAAMLAPLAPSQRNELVSAMAHIANLLEPRHPASRRIAQAELRDYQAGDLGWVIQRHGEIYAREYGFDRTFEELVADIVARFAKRHDSSCERCWIAVEDNVRQGAVFLVRRSATIAQLRLLIVEPTARGTGLGSRLVDECERFARAAGYHRITLWTNEVLHAARHIYERAGYVRVASEAHTSFGHELVGETWELLLKGSKRKP